MKKPSCPIVFITDKNKFLYFKNVLQNLIYFNEEYKKNFAGLSGYGKQQAKLMFNIGKMDALCNRLNENNFDPTIGNQVEFTTKLKMSKF